MTFSLTLLFMFLVFWRPQEWLVPALFGWPILDVVFFMAVLALLMELQQGQVGKVNDIPQVYLLLGLWFATLMSHIGNTYFEGLIFTYADTLKYCIFTILLFAVVDRPSRLRAVITVFIAMTCMMAVHSHLQQTQGYGFANQPPVMSWRPGIEELVPRSQFFGIFEDPNDMGQVMAASIPFAFALTRRLRFIGLALAGVLVWVLMRGIEGTLSRGTELGMIAMAAYMLLLLLPARWQFRLSILGVCLALLACPLAGKLMEQSAHDRVVFWGEANYAFKSNALFGVGYGMIGEYIRGRAVHNAFVACYSEIGVFGYFFWFTLLLLGFRNAWSTREALRDVPGRDAAWLRRFSGLAAAAMAGYTVSAYFLSRAFVYPTFFLFAILGVLPYVARRLLVQSGQEPSIVKADTWEKILPMGILGSLVSVVYVYISIILLNRSWA